MHDIAYTYVPKSFNNTWTKNNQLEIRPEPGNNKEYILPAPRIEFLLF